MSSHCNDKLTSNNLSLPWQNDCMRLFENGQKSSEDRRNKTSFYEAISYQQLLVPRIQQSMRAEHFLGLRNSKI